MRDIYEVTEVPVKELEEGEEELGAKLVLIGRGLGRVGVQEDFLRYLDVI